jgi:hypothetical protein
MIAEYRRQLAATLAWCEPRFDPARAADSLRSPELGPRRNIVHGGSHVDVIAAEVAAVLARRQELLGCSVDSAIRCNPEESIRWASEQPEPLIQELRRLAVLR